MSGAPAAGDELVPSLRQLLLELGGAMIAAGDSVDAVGAHLGAIVSAYSVEHVQVSVMPTTIIVGTGHGSDAQVQLIAPRRTPLRFDQVAELYVLVDDVSSGSISPTEGLARLRAIYAMQPRFRWPVRTFGHAVLTTGLALLLQPTAGAVLAAFVLGLLVGLLKLPRLATLDLVFPVLMSFLVSVAVFSLLQHVQIDNPVRILIPPLATFLPGGMLTIATVELAAGQMVSGASRLVNGLVQLMLLAFGILAAGTLFDLAASELSDNPVNRLGWWAPWLGVAVFALGNFLHFSSPGRTLPWILLVLTVAYAGQVAGAALFGGTLSGFFGAVAMTPLVLWVESLRAGPPKLVTFLPGFWLLVPGAAGLIGVTEMLGVNQQLGVQAVLDTLVAVMSIALGVLIGTALYHTTDTGVRAIARSIPIPGRPE